MGREKGRGRKNEEQEGKEKKEGNKEEAEKKVLNEAKRKESKREKNRMKDGGTKKPMYICVYDMVRQMIWCSGK